MTSITVKTVHPSPKKLARGFVPTKYVAIVADADVVIHRTHNFTTAEAASAHAHRYCETRGIALDTDM